MLEPNILDEEGFEGGRERPPARGLGEERVAPRS
jgi:hypothetical protein